MPAPESTHSARAIALRCALSIAGQYVSMVDGYNKRAWQRGLAEHLAAHEPAVALALRADAEATLYHDVIEEAIRSTRGTDVEDTVRTIKDLEQFKKRVQRDNRIVQIRQSDGSHVAKRLRDVTPREFDALAQYYERRSQSDARRARYYRECCRQMRLAGLAETDPLSKLLAI